jgi:hypothetical protein
MKKSKQSLELKTVSIGDKVTFQSPISSDDIFIITDFVVVNEQRIKATAKRQNNHEERLTLEFWYALEV